MANAGKWQSEELMGVGKRENWSACPRGPLLLSLISIALLSSLLPLSSLSIVATGYTLAVNSCE